MPSRATGREGRHSSPLGDGGRLAAVLAVAVLALILIVPSFTTLYLLDQKSMLQVWGPAAADELVAANGRTPAASRTR
ncbi:MAG TPA: hypothetical protein VNB87_15430 [Propionibacteriaceae bacterium]|nr:hypothetical protein [Propionibacteriaceae bacterium]